MAEIEKKKLEEEKIESVSREEVFGMLDKIDSFKESDVRSFYASYSERRNNADARKRLKVEGPKNILEDYCVLSLFENKVFIKGNASDDALKEVIEEAGYTVGTIKEIHNAG